LLFGHRPVALARSRDRFRFLVVQPCFGLVDGTRAKFFRVVHRIQFSRTEGISGPPGGDSGVPKGALKLIAPPGSVNLESPPPDDFR